MKKSKKNKSSAPSESKNLGVRVPLDIFNKIDSIVDSVHFRSRAHLVEVILREWLEVHKYNDK